MWSENLNEIESAKCYNAWLKIKTEVDKFDNPKTIKQCKLKIRNLKDSFKKAKEENKKTGNEANFPEFYEIFDEILGERDGIKLTAAKEVGVSGISVVTNEKLAEENELPQKAVCEEEGSEILEEEKRSDKRKSNDGYESNDEFLNELDEIRKENGQPKKKKKPEKSFQEQIVELQKSQLDLFKESEKRQQELMVTVIENNRNSRKKDRDFFLQLSQLLNKN